MCKPFSTDRQTHNVYVKLISNKRLSEKPTLFNITQNTTLTRTVLIACTYIKKSSYFKDLLLIIAESECIYKKCIGDMDG